MVIYLQTDTRNWILPKHPLQVNVSKWELIHVIHSNNSNKLFSPWQQPWKNYVFKRNQLEAKSCFDYFLFAFSSLKVILSTNRSALQSVLTSPSSHLHRPLPPWDTRNIFSSWLSSISLSFSTRKLTKSRPKEKAFFFNNHQMAFFHFFFDKSQQIMIKRLRNESNSIISLHLPAEGKKKLLKSSLKPSSRAKLVDGTKNKTRL